MAVVAKSSHTTTTSGGGGHSGGNENPVPSITLSITQDDVKRVLEASEALTKQLNVLRQKEEDEEMEKENSSSPSKKTAAAAPDEQKSPVVATRRTNKTSKDDNDDTDDDDNSCNNKDSGNTNSKDQDDHDAESGDPPLRTVSCDDDAKETETATAKNNNDNNTTTRSKRPLHDLIYDAARQCDNTMLKSFLERMKNSGSSPSEIRAGVMVFSDMDLNSKIGHIFSVLGEENQSMSCGEANNNDDNMNSNSDNNVTTCLSRDGALSLFRAIIVAISSCIHKNARLQIEIDKDTVEPPRKKTKPNPLEPDDNKNELSGGDSIPSLQSPSASFDSAVAPFKDDEDFLVTAVRKEFQDIAMFARDRLVKYTEKKLGTKNPNGVVITFQAFHDWRRAEGGRIAPWLELLDLSRWTRPTERRPTQSQQAKPKATPAPPPATPAQPKQQEPVTQEPVETKTSPAPTKPESPKPSASAVKEEIQSPSSNSISASMPVSNKKDDSAPSTLPSTGHLAAASQTPMFVCDSPSRTILSFDFSASLPGDRGDDGFIIAITEENLKTFRNLVRTSGLMHRSCQEVTSILWEASKPRVYQGNEIKVVPIERFHTCLHQLLGSGSSTRLSKLERDVFSSCFVDFFMCFDSGIIPLESGEALTSELVVGFCFLCAGNKSTKLATGFDMLEKERGRGLTNQQLVDFLRSYLTMLAGVSLLTSSSDGIMKPKLNSTIKKVMYEAVENGARWTLRHFLKSLGVAEGDTRARHTFDSFASWYSNGGYNVAPWLELLDLKKLLSLVADDDLIMKSPGYDDSLPAFPGPKTSSPDFELSPRPAIHPSSHHRSARPAPIHPSATSSVLQTPYGHTGHTPAAAALAATPPHILFTFPLANQCSLVVLKEDASYVRGVVDQLGLLSFSPDEVWSTLYGIASRRPPLPPAKGQKIQSKNMQTGKSMLVSKEGFVECMLDTVQTKGKTSKKRSAAGLSKSNAHDILANFFQSFDLLQSDRVSLNELMGGLTLLCGGKKSTKLSFAFSVFDRRQNGKKKVKKTQSSSNSLDGEELFLFLRSFLIVMFSCCRQSWDLTDDAVNRYIADTANMVAEDVMRYQWRTKKKERVDFDEFGQWYNEGGFETAPWLELLDLKKWVLVDNFEDHEKHRMPLPSPSAGLVLPDPDCPPPPPDAEMDPSFFDDDAGGIMPMDSIDEMDLLLMQQPSHDKDDIDFSKLAKSYSFSPRPSPKPLPPPPERQNSIKFHLVTKDNHDGYVVSVSQRRIRHLRHVLLDSGLHQIDGEHACGEILAKAYRDEKAPPGTTNYVLTKKDFDFAIIRIITSRSMSVETQTTLTTILREIFAAFDYEGTGTANAFDVACGFTVLCKGKKSDKLEYSFETLDRAKRGYLSRADSVRYLRSFLIVLLTMVTTNALESDFMEDSMMTLSGEKCDRSLKAIAQVVEKGCRWASDQAMKGVNSSQDTITFDDFAHWYSTKGYQAIPWLELLDLNKWALGA